MMVFCIFLQSTLDKKEREAAERRARTGLKRKLRKVEMQFSTLLFRRTFRQNLLI